MTRRRLAAASWMCAIGLTIVPLAGQSPTPGQVTTPASVPSVNPRPQGATVRGRVVNASGFPVSRVQVTLGWPREAGQEPRPPVGAKTNALGAFEFTNVPPGTYGVLVVRAPYLAMVWGPEFLHPNELGRGTNLDLKDGQVVDGIDITMRDGIVVAGRILDERGQPMPYISITASVQRGVACDLNYVTAPASTGQMEIQDPALSGMTEMSTSTNAKGEFRLSRLFPGSYYFCAKSSESWPVRRGQPEIRSYAVTFYPGVTAPAAQPVVLRSGDALTRLEWNMVLSAFYRVSGRVTDAGGRPMASAPVALKRIMREAVAQAGRINDLEIVVSQPSLRTETREDGSFEIAGVRPGEYYFEAGSVSEKIVVYDSDVSGLSVTVR